MQSHTILKTSYYWDLNQKHWGQEEAAHMFVLKAATSEFICASEKPSFNGTWLDLTHQQSNTDLLHWHGHSACQIWGSSGESHRKSIAAWKILIHLSCWLVTHICPLVVFRQLLSLYNWWVYSQCIHCRLTYSTGLKDLHSYTHCTVSCTI